jgi:transcriptional regulator with XRE-family HTH domain
MNFCANSIIMANLSDRIRSFRTEKALSLPKLSELSNVSLGLLSKLENDPTSNPSLDTLHKLAKALDTTIADLIGDNVTVPIREVSQTQPVWKKELVTWLKKNGQKPDKDIFEALYVLQNRKGSARSPEDWKLLYRSMESSFPRKT